jgi:hypothetical protein
MNSSAFHSQPQEVPIQKNWDLLGILHCGQNALHSLSQTGEPNQPFSPGPQELNKVGTADKIYYHTFNKDSPSLLCVLETT